MNNMPFASTAFISSSIAAALHERYAIYTPPVPVEEFLRQPPAALAQDLALADVLPFGEALWMRLQNGQGCIFSNPGLPIESRRHALARALFVGLCASRRGRAVGLPPVPNDRLPEQQEIFARELLIPVRFLPADWRARPASELAVTFGVPQSMMANRLSELNQG